MNKKITAAVTAAAMLSMFAGCTQNNARPDFKNNIEMTFDDASLNKIFLETDAIMSDPDAFWTSDEAYQLVAGIHKNNNLTVDMDAWGKRMNVILAMSPEERRNHIGFRTAEAIMSREEQFKTAGIDHIGSFLPATLKPFSKKMYLTAECPFRCFMTNANVVINVTADYFKNDAEGMMNIILHEVFHIGYGYNRSMRRELELPDVRQYGFIDALQNEGIATYVSYTGQSLFANVHDQDYALIDTDGEFEKALKKINSLFTKAMEGGYPDLQQEAWQLGVTERAYYITGFYMARTIDESLGRQALIRTIETGPRDFVSTYNRLVPADRRVVEFEMPAELTLYQQMRLALLEQDGKRYERVKNRIVAEEQLDPSLNSQLNSLGYAMLARDRYADAVDVLLLNTVLFPDDANTWDSLGEAYMRSGENEKALINFRNSLRLNPANVNAKSMIKQLEKE